MMFSHTALIGFCLVGATALDDSQVFLQGGMDWPQASWTQPFMKNAQKIGQEAQSMFQHPQWDYNAKNKQAATRTAQGYAYDKTMLKELKGIQDHAISPTEALYYRVAQEQYAQKDAIAHGNDKWKVSELAKKAGDQADLDVIAARSLYVQGHPYDPTSYSVGPAKGQPPIHQHTFGLHPHHHHGHHGHHNLFQQQQHAQQQHATPQYNDGLGNVGANQHAAAANYANPVGAAVAGLNTAVQNMFQPHQQMGYHPSQTLVSGPQSRNLASMEQMGESSETSNEEVDKTKRLDLPESDMLPEENELQKTYEEIDKLKSELDALPDV